MNPAPVFRFAPSPSGLLHLGHAYSALSCHRAAREAGGRFLLRIEDIDHTRCRPEFERQILDDLAWLGLSWEQPVRRQSEHMADYEQALRRLRKMGLIFPCPASRRQIAERAARAGAEARDPDGGLIYPPRSSPGDPDPWPLPITPGEAVSWRLDMGRAAALAQQMTGAEWWFDEQGKGPAGEHGRQLLDPLVWGDVVLARRDIGTSYHLSVVVDDALQGVSHVTRGQDLFAATHIHRLLQILLELPRPVYHHHALVRDEDGRRLSKTDRDTSLKSLREQGMTPAEIAALCGIDNHYDNL